MGGDDAPEIVIRGVSLAMKQHPNLSPILVGDEAKIAPIVKRYKSLASATILHSDEAIADDEKPSAALRRGENSSMRMAINLVKEGKADAIVSGGNSGALMAMAVIVLRTMEGINRPALAAYAPTEKAPCCMLDLGANIDCSAENLVQFAIMGDACVRVLSGKPKPSIGLLNVGEEEQKGKPAIQEAATILSDSSIALNYVGFIEGDDVTKGVVDVMVSDGFSGNVFLKASEGAARFMTLLLRRNFRASLVSRLGYFLVRPALRRLMDYINPQNYNGAVLLGLNGIVVKSHGGATAKGFANAIGVAANMINNGFMSDLKQSVERTVVVVEKTAEQIAERENS